jgi:hypothetical protein
MSGCDRDGSVPINRGWRQRGVQHDCGWQSPSPSPGQLITFSNSDLLRRANNFVWVKSDFALGTSRLSSRVRELLPLGKLYQRTQPCPYASGSAILGPLLGFMASYFKISQGHSKGPYSPDVYEPVKLFSASSRLSTPSNQNLTSFAP